MSKFCEECGKKASVKAMAYLLPFRICLACGHLSGNFSILYVLLLAPIESYFGKGYVSIMSYGDQASYFKAVKMYFDKREVIKK